MRRLGGAPAVMWMSEAPRSSAARTMSAKSMDMGGGSAGWSGFLSGDGRSGAEDADHLVDGGEALPDLPQGVVAQGVHALPAGGGRDRVARGGLQRKLADRGGDGHDLVDADAAAVSAASAPGAAGGLEGLEVLVALEAGVTQRIRSERHRAPAALAQGAREPLCDH